MQSVSITTEVRIPLRRGIFVRYTLCDKFCQCLATGQWFSPCILVSSANKPDRHDINEILLKVAFNTRNKEGNLLNRYILICIPDKKESRFSITNGVDNLFFFFHYIGSSTWLFLSSNVYELYFFTGIKENNISIPKITWVKLSCSVISFWNRIIRLVIAS